MFLAVLALLPESQQVKGWTGLMQGVYDELNSLGGNYPANPNAVLHWNTALPNDNHPEKYIVPCGYEPPTADAGSSRCTSGNIRFFIRWNS